MKPAGTGPRATKIGAAARRTDSRPGLVATARFIRRLLPGDTEVALVDGDRLPHHLSRLVSELRTERPSAARELGLGALQAWQALSEAQRRGRGTADVAILFTDLVGFSSWALAAGDTAALELLKQVGAAEERSVSDSSGIVVKRLGDGAMAVFSRAEQAVEAALDLQHRLTEIEVHGHTPELRAGVHLGRPRKIGGDYLGIDVNIASRVADAAGAGELLVSDTACETLDSSRFSLGPRRRLEAEGAPRDLSVCLVKAA